MKYACMWCFQEHLTYYPADFRQARYYNMDSSGQYLLIALIHTAEIQLYL